MKKSELENGMIVQLRNKSKYILIKDFTNESLKEGKDILLGYEPNDDYMALEDYDNDLLCLKTSPFSSVFDIIKVFCLNGCGSRELVLLWERKEIALTNDERKLLEVIYNQGYRWIARDYLLNRIFFHTYKPYKEVWYSAKFWESESSKTSSVVCPFTDMFQFIKWEDEEPYNIKELLKEN